MVQVSAPRRTTDLLNDTTYRRTRRTVIDAAHRLDEAIARTTRGTRRVLFEAASPLSVAIFRPLFEQLRRDERLEFWCTASDESWNARDIFGHTTHVGRVITPQQARWRKFDLYVNTDFWNMTWLPRRVRRIHLFHGVAGKYDLDAPVDLAPTIATFDRLFFPNADRLGRYVEAGLVNGQSPQAALVGYPKVDCLVDGTLDRDEVHGRLGLDHRRQTVMYAPTWSPHSSLNTMGESVIQALLRLDANVIIKLHDRSYGSAVRGSGGIDWRAYLDGIGHAGRVHVAQHADACPYLCAADALVTDHSSVGFEFLLLDRPIVVLDSPELALKAHISRHKLALMRRVADVARNASELTRHLATALQNPRRFGLERRAVADELFHRPGTATVRAALATYQLLAITPPSELAARVASSPVAAAATASSAHAS
jgi:hypothetical protein